VTPKITRQLHRHSAVEPVIDDLKSERRIGRNYLWHREGDAANAVLGAISSPSSLSLPKLIFGPPSSLGSAFSSSRS